jgi:hypothetical protein
MLSDVKAEKAGLPAAGEEAVPLNPLAVSGVESFVVRMAVG